MTNTDKIKELEAKSAEMQKRSEAALKICEVYFNIAAEILGKDKVRKLFSEKLEALKKPKPGGLWKPEPGEEFYYINADGNICSHQYLIDINLLIQADNCFQNSTAAILHRHKLEVLQKIREIAASDGWVADWSDENQDKYYLSQTMPSKDIDFFSTRSSRDIGVLYMSEASAKRCLDELGDELNVLLEG